jgi:hypothetical protein
MGSRTSSHNTKLLIFVGMFLAIVLSLALVIHLRNPNLPLERVAFSSNTEVLSGMLPVKFEKLASSVIRNECDDGMEDGTVVFFSLLSPDGDRVIVPRTVIEHLRDTFVNLEIHGVDECYKDTDGIYKTIDNEIGVLLSMRPVYLDDTNFEFDFVSTTGPLSGLSKHNVVYSFSGDRWDLKQEGTLAIH